MQINDERTRPARPASPAGRRGTELTPERIAEVRRRLREGAYDTAEVAEEVARRILARGDL